MASFRPAFDKTLAVEGGYSNHAADPGGETMYGIAKRYWPEMWRDGPPTLDAARNFYEREFWKSLRLDKLQSQPIAEEIFDTAVNMGAGRAVKIAQEAYNYFATRKGLRALLVDGEFGPKTLGAINQFATNSKAYEAALLAKMNHLQGNHYDSRADATPDFLIGWWAKRIGSFE